MKIVIAGSGATGVHLARALSVENQDVVLLGSDAALLRELESTGNFLTYHGDALSGADLERCGVGDADLFVGVMADECANLVSAQLARGYGARRSVARVDSRSLGEGVSARVLKAAGIDELVYPEGLVAAEIASFLRHNWLSESFRVSGGALKVAGVRIGEESVFAGRELKEVGGAGRTFHVCAVKRAAEMLIPRGDTRICAGDILYFAVLPGDMERLGELCGRHQTPVRRVMITGAGRVTENLLEAIGARYAVAVVEPDAQRCRYIAGKFPEATVVNARADDIAALKDEGIERCDVFLALTRSSETNIVSCMVAREHGVRKTLARIEELQYIPEARSLSIDKIVNKKLINTGQIMNLLIDSSGGNARCMALDSAEIIDVVARAGSRIVSRRIGELSLPAGITIGGLIRDGHGSLVDGSTRIQPGDHVILFCAEGSLSKVERLFR